MATEKILIVEDDLQIQTLLKARNAEKSMLCKFCGKPIKIDELYVSRS